MAEHAFKTVAAPEAPSRKRGKKYHGVFTRLTTEDDEYKSADVTTGDVGEGLGVPTVIVPETQREGATADGFHYGALRLGNHVRVPVKDIFDQFSSSCLRGWLSFHTHLT